MRPTTNQGRYFKARMRCEVIAEEFFCERNTALLGYLTTNHSSWLEVIKNYNGLLDRLEHFARKMDRWARVNK